MRPVIWHPKAQAIIRDFPEQVKRDLGYLLFRLQKGDALKMPHSRSISSIAKGVFELRLKDKDGIYRAFYFQKAQEGILVFHAFIKKSQKTPTSEIELGIKRLKEMKNA